MMVRRNLHVGVGALGALAFTVSALCAGAAHAQTATEAALEARIEQLEQTIRELGAGAPASSAPQATALQTKRITPNAEPNTRFAFGGFIKLDALASDYEDGEIADGSIGRDFYLPGAIPVGAANENVDYDMHVKQSRFIFGTDTDLPNNGLVSSRLEFDLYGSSLGDERVTNTYGLQLRHAFVQYRNWLVGQTWTTFQDAGALPETADYIGPTDGVAFVRQPMIRYTAGGFSIALENPETTLTPFGGGASGNARISSDDNNTPDLTAAYTYKFAGGASYLRAAVLARQLDYETTGVNTTDDSAFGGGLSLAGKIAFGARDDLRFTVTAGEGIGRYVGVNFVNDAVLDAQGQLETISGWAGFAAWRHLWRPDLRSTLMFSTSSYDNDAALTGPGVNKRSMSWAANLFYSPAPKLDLGIELRMAERELEGGAEGSMTRLHAVAKYSF